MLQYRFWIYVSAPYFPENYTQHLSAGIIDGANDGRGRGRQGKQIVYTYDLLLMARSPVIAGMK